VSKYTTEVRFICEQFDGKTESADYADVDEIIGHTASKIIGNYPIFDEAYREVLNRKIIKHFYTQEIGYETVGLWRLKLNTRMNEIMPYYNQLYKSELLEFNPLYDYGFTRTYSKAENGENEEEQKVKGSENVSRTSDEERTRNEEGSEAEKKSELSSEIESSEAEKNKNSKNSQSKTGIETSERENANSEESNNTEDSDTVQTGSENSESKNINRYSDTPQGQISLLENNAYLTNATIVDEEGNTVNSQNTGVKTKGNETKEGNEKETTDRSNSESVEGNQSETNKENNEVNKSGNKTEDNVVNRSNNRTENIANVGAENRNNDEARNKTGNYTNLQEYTEMVSGKRGFYSYSELLLKFRDTFLNIDMLVINALQDLFMGVW